MHRHISYHCLKLCFIIAVICESTAIYSAETFTRSFHALGRRYLSAASAVRPESEAGVVMAWLLAAHHKTTEHRFL